MRSSRSGLKETTVRFKVNILPLIMLCEFYGKNGKTLINQGFSCVKEVKNLVENKRSFQPYTQTGFIHRECTCFP